MRSDKKRGRNADLEKDMQLFCQETHELLPTIINATRQLQETALQALKEQSVAKVQGFPVEKLQPNPECGSSGWSWSVSEEFSGHKFHFQDYLSVFPHLLLKVLPLEWNEIRRHWAVFKNRSIPFLEQMHWKTRAMLTEGKLPVVSLYDSDLDLVQKLASRLLVAAQDAEEAAFFPLVVTISLPGHVFSVYALFDGNRQKMTLATASWETSPEGKPIFDFLESVLRRFNDETGWTTWADPCGLPDPQKYHMQKSRSGRIEETELLGICASVALTLSAVFLVRFLGVGPRWTGSNQYDSNRYTRMRRKRTGMPGIMPEERTKVLAESLRKHPQIIESIAPSFIDPRFAPVLVELLGDPSQPEQVTKKGITTINYLTRLGDDERSALLDASVAPVLVKLLQDQSQRKQAIENVLDVLESIYNLSFFGGDRSHSALLDAGVAPVLVELLKDPSQPEQVTRTVLKVISDLALTDNRGRSALLDAGVVPVLDELSKDASRGLETTNLIKKTQGWLKLQGDGRRSWWTKLFRDLSTLYRSRLGRPPLPEGAVEESMGVVGTSDTGDTSPSADDDLTANSRERAVERALRAGPP